MELENACGAMKSPKSAIWTTLSNGILYALIGDVPLEEMINKVNGDSLLSPLINICWLHPLLARYAQ